MTDKDNGIGVAGRGEPWFIAHERRTHSVHHSAEEARKAAHDLGRLMNGVPCGYLFAVQEKMGKFAFISYLGYCR